MSFYSQKQKGELEENDPSEKRWIVGNPEKKRFQEHLLENSFLEVFEQNISHALQGSSVLIVPDTKKTFVIAFESLGIRKNDEILVPAFCDSVVTSPILRIGAVPIFSDISLNDMRWIRIRLKKKSHLGRKLSSLRIISDSLRSGRKKY